MKELLEDPARRSTSYSRVPPILVILLAAIVLLSGLAYMGLRLLLPGDASSPVVDFLGMQSGELSVQPLSPDAQSLQNGDVVTAIQGRPVDAYIQDLFSRQPPEAPVSRIEYTVLRGGHILQRTVILTPFPLARLIKANWSIYFYLIYLELVSLLVFILRPRLAAVQLFFMVSSALFSSALVYFPGMQIDDLLYRWPVILYVWGAVALYGFVLAGLVHLSLAFPKRHLLLVRHPAWVLWIYLGVWLPLFLYWIARWPAVVSPTGRLGLLIQGTTLMSAVYFPLLLLSTFSSYRTGSVREKRQVRWVMWSLVIALVPYLVFSVLPSLLGLPIKLATSMLGVLWCTVPTAFAIAVLREQLFDIDVIIRRTLIYTALTGTLAVIYYVSVVVLQAFFQGFTGQNQPPVATVLSTLVIAALFIPLRGRIQADIDRRFYRRKYDAEKTVAAFGLTVRNEVDMERLTGHLLGVVEETMEPHSLSLWILKR
jgi:hypothetical protein